MASVSTTQNFIEPYREFIVGGEKPERIAYKQMNFTDPARAR